MVIVNLRRSYNWQFEDIRDLLSELDKLNTVAPSDDVRIYLPKHETVSEFALALIWTRLRWFQNQPCKNRYLAYGPDDVAYFEERHFFDRLMGKKPKWLSPEAPFHFETFSLKGDENEIAARTAAIARKSISTLPLASEVGVHISELVSNAFNHSLASADVGCSSKYDASSGRFEFSIADEGSGVRDSFSRNKAIWDSYRSLSEPELLERAAEKNVTCNPSAHRQYAHRNSGIGLYFLKEFSVSHSGRLIIVSGNGYYSIDGNKVKKRTLALPWKGTGVFFTANVSGAMSDKYANLIGDYTSNALNTP